MVILLSVSVETVYGVSMSSSATASSKTVSFQYRLLSLSLSILSPTSTEPVLVQGTGSV